MNQLEREYKKSRKRVIKKIYQSKEKAWRELIREIDEDQWGRPYKVILRETDGKDGGIERSTAGFGSRSIGVDYGV